jgi:hypothetical protein
MFGFKKYLSNCSTHSRASGCNRTSSHCARSCDLVYDFKTGKEEETKKKKHKGTALGCVGLRCPERCWERPSLKRSDIRVRKSLRTQNLQTAGDGEVQRARLANCSCRCCMSMRSTTVPRDVRIFCTKETQYSESSIAVIVMQEEGSGKP